MKQKYLILCATAMSLLAFAPSEVLAQTKKKITIIEETTDANGNTTVTTTVKEGENGENVNVNVEEKKSDDIDIKFTDDDGKSRSMRITINDQAMRDGEPRIKRSQDGAIEVMEININADDIVEKIEKVIIVNREKRAFLGVMGNGGTDAGLTLYNIISGSPAEKSGLQKGDQLISIDGNAVNTFDELSDMMRDKFKPSQEVDVKYKRGNETKTVKVRLATNQEEDWDMSRDWCNQIFNIGDMNGNGNNSGGGGCNGPRSKIRLGVSCQDNTSGKGVTIIDVDEQSAAQAAGLKEGDIIYDVDGTPINKFQELSDAVKAHEFGETVKVKYIRDGKEYETTATLKEIEATEQRRVMVRTIINDGKENTTTEETIINEKPEIIVNGNEEAVELSLFPNPSSNSITVQFKSADKTAPVISILDINGKEVYTETVTSFDGNYRKDIDLGSNAAGNYILNIKQGAAQFSEQVILNK